MNDALLSSAKGTGTDTWFTPEVVLGRVRKVGTIALDPCTTADNPTGAQRFFTEEDDGLAQSWAVKSGLVYCNPPYSDAKGWAAKVKAEAAWRVPMVVLVAARTDTKWFRELWSASNIVAFWNGRLKFSGSKNSAPFPSAVFGVNVDTRRFTEAFCDVAIIA